MHGSTKHYKQNHIWIPRGEKEPHSLQFVALCTTGGAMYHPTEIIKDNNKTNCERCLWLGINIVDDLDNN